MGNGKNNVEQRPQSYNVQEVAGYVAILGTALFCVGASVAAWMVRAGFCKWWETLLIGGTVASLGMVLTACWLIKDRVDLLWEIEKATGVDIDRDGSVGEPEQRGQDSRKPTLPAPSGNRVLISDLLTFAKLAPDDKVGTSFQGFWSDRWPHEYWQDVMDIWAAHRCVEPRRERHKSKWLAKSYEAAAARLLGTYANRPTP